MFTKQRHKLISLLCVAVIVLGGVMLANAYDRPHLPQMDYVPQNYGVYDTYYCNFKESDCRACHGTTTAWRHHATQYAINGQCATTCHNPSIAPYTDPERDCKVCHVDGGPVEGLGNPPIPPLGFPHHRSDQAAARNCLACHDATLVSNPETQYVPQFDPTTITPLPVSCENCHWPTGVAPEGQPPLADWNLWTSFPRPTTWPFGTPNPAPIEANGPVMTGSVTVGDPPPTAGKPYRPLTGTHHEADGAVSTDCVLCHGTAPGGGYQLDPTYPYAIRACENCHDIYTLHYGIGQEHTTDGIGGLGMGGYTVNGTLDSMVLRDMKCIGCHDQVPGPLPAPPVSPAVVDYLEPPMASAGATISIYAALGSSFGTQGPDDQVVMQQGLSGLIPVGISSWNPDKIVITVPGGIFATESFVNVAVQKHYMVEIIGDFVGDEDGICDPGEPCTQITQNSVAPGGGLYLRQHPILNFLNPDSGTWSTVVTLNAVTGSFHTQREQIYDAHLNPCVAPNTCYGYSTRVEIVASNDTYRVTEMSDDVWPTNNALLDPWTNNQIKINISAMPPAGIAGYGTLRDLETDYWTPLADLYKGNWQLYVITDYFKTTPGNEGYTGPYMLQHPSGHLLGTIDTVHYQVLHTEISDPLPFFATDTPFIYSRTPLSIKQNSLGAVYGINFGTTQDTSSVYVTKCDGSMTPLYPLTVYQWANTRVVFRAPASPPIPGGGATGCIMVRVPKAAPHATDSNLSEGIYFYP